MKKVFRQRVFYPVVIPVAILVGVVGTIALVAWLLLNNTREGAIALAIVGAAGILVAAALAASQEGLSKAKQAGVAMAALVPLAVGGVIAAGVADIEPDQLNINAEPHVPALALPEVAPEAPVMAAVDAASFCLPTDGGCEPTQEWEIALTEEYQEVFTYTFDNQDEVTSPHNLTLYELPEESAYGSAVDQLGTDLILPTLPEPIGVATVSYQFAWPGEETGGGDAPEEFYFVCTLHPSTMWGVGTFTP